MDSTFNMQLSLYFLIFTSFVSPPHKRQKKPQKKKVKMYDSIPVSDAITRLNVSFITNWLFSNQLWLFAKTMEIQQEIARNGRNFN